MEMLELVKLCWWICFTLQPLSRKSAEFILIDLCFQFMKINKKLQKVLILNKFGFWFLNTFINKNFFMIITDLQFWTKNMLGLDGGSLWLTLKKPLFACITEFCLICKVKSTLGGDWDGILGLVRKPYSGLSH